MVTSKGSVPLRVSTLTSYISMIKYFLVLYSMSQPVLYVKHSGNRFRK